MPCCEPKAGAPLLSRSATCKIRRSPARRARFLCACIRLLAPVRSRSWCITTVVAGSSLTWTCTTRRHALTNAAGAIVISVEYRQAPENPFPAAVEDAYASYIWATQNAASIGGDPKRVAVAGESAGGNFATVVARRARDAGAQLPVHQLLVYPIVNYNFDTPSYQQFANAKPLSKGLMQWFFSYYLRSEADGASPDVSPLHADVSRLPLATIIAAEIDPLLSEGQQYAQKLRDAGVPVTYQLFTGVTHEFFGTGAVVDEGKQAVALAGNQLRAAFGLAPLPPTGANDLPLGASMVLAGMLLALGACLVLRTRAAAASANG